MLYRVVVKYIQIYTTSGLRYADMPAGPRASRLRCFAMAWGTPGEGIP